MEALLSGTIPGLPCIILHHPVLSVKAGEEFLQQYDLATEIPHRNTTAGDDHPTDPSCAPVLVKAKGVILSQGFC